MTDVETEVEVRKEDRSAAARKDGDQNGDERSPAPAAPQTEDGPYTPQPEPLIPELLLANLKKLAKVLVTTLGNQCEVVIHDLYDLEHSVVWIEGDVTGRKPGAPMTDLGIEKIRKGQTDDLPNYRTQTPDGKMLKSSSTFILDEDGKAIGAFCLNWDVTALNTAQQILDSVTQVNTDEAINETFVEDAGEIIEKSVERYVVESGKPLTMMNKQDRVQMVRFLNQKGIFQLQRAVPILADLLGVTRQTVYNYMEEAGTS